MITMWILGKGPSQSLREKIKKYIDADLLIFFNRVTEGIWEVTSSIKVIWMKCEQLEMLHIITTSETQMVFL